MLGGGCKHWGSSVLRFATPSRPQGRAGGEDLRQRPVCTDEPRGVGGNGPRLHGRAGGGGGKGPRLRARVCVLLGAVDLSSLHREL